MAASYPLVNGFRHGWAQIEISANGKVNLGIIEINYSNKLNQAMVYGQGILPIGRTLGKAEYEGDCTFLLDEFNTFTQSLGPAFGTKTFDIVVSYDSPLNQLVTIVDTLQGCMISSIENAGATNGSSDAITRKCQLSIMGILYNGFSAEPGQLTVG